MALLFFPPNYTVHQRHSQCTHTHSYEYTHANPTLRSIFGDYTDKSSRLTKSPHAPRCRRVNPEKFAPTGSRNQEVLRALSRRSLLFFCVSRENTRRSTLLCAREKEHGKELVVMPLCAVYPTYTR
jgi:hypothetical protein